MIAELLTLDATLLRRELDTARDEYGNPAYVEVSEPLKGELQQESSSEAHGAASQVSLWRVFLPATAPARGWDAVRFPVDGGQVFELEGDAWLARNPRTGEPSHMEARARRVDDA